MSSQYSRLPSIDKGFAGEDLEVVSFVRSEKSRSDHPDAPILAELISTATINRSFRASLNHEVARSPD